VEWAPRARETGRKGNETFGQSGRPEDPACHRRFTNVNRS
jgi:hypothetical protein